MTSPRQSHPAPIRRPLGTDVLTAARARIAYVLDRFTRVYVSFSGGKDSTVLLHLAMEAAIERQRRIGVLFIDWEAQYQLTIAHVRDCLQRYAAHIDPYWIALPLTTTNAVSMHEPEWVCWDTSKRDIWVRDLPADAITDASQLPCHYHAMTFEEFVEAFGHWYGGGKLTACLVGIRCGESLNRFRALVMRKSCFERARWTTWKSRALYNAYPLYDWRVQDVWTYFGRTDLPYNAIYDRMHRAGLTPHQMRICEPYGDEQRRGLWLYHVIEPETWPKVAARVAGANSGALYGDETGNILGNRRIALPAGHTWRSFAMFLLDTMPPSTADHYRDKIAVYLRYCEHTLQESVPDAAPGDTGAKDVASWRRICRTLLRNDYWCKGLSFSPTKAEYYERWRALMRRRRAAWESV